MRYTETKPSAPGWYWHRWVKGTFSSEEVVLVVALQGGGFIELTTSGGRYQLETLGGEWAGPLQPPLPWTNSEVPADGLLDRVTHLERVVQEITLSLADRVAAQSEILSRRAEKQP